MTHKQHFNDRATLCDRQNNNRKTQQWKLLTSVDCGLLGARPSAIKTLFGTRNLVTTCYLSVSTGALITCSKHLKTIQSTNGSPRNCCEASSCRQCLPISSSLLMEVPLKCHQLNSQSRRLWSKTFAAHQSEIKISEGETNNNSQEPSQNYLYRGP